MKDNNELLAKFMGIEVTYHGPVLYISEDGYIDFGESEPYWPDRNWNQLMPIVEKIEKLHISNFKYDMNQIASGNWPKDDEYWQVIALPLATPIGEVYKKIVGFINWYNTTKQQDQTPIDECRTEHGEEC